MLVVVIVAVLAVSGSWYLASQLHRSDTASLEQKVKEVISQASMSVFTVVTARDVSHAGAEIETNATGSAFAFTKSGGQVYLITNFHVVEDFSSVRVFDAGGRSLTAQVVGSDPLKDIAVLKIPDLFDYPVLEIARETPEPGSFVVALGSPYMFNNSATFGIVSAVNRSLRSRLGYFIPGVIQIDASINQGNSGGPLLLLDGRVVGVNTAIFSISRGFEGIGFAIPASEAVRIARRIIDEGEVITRLFGISCADFDKSVANSFNLPVDGVLILCLDEDSPLRQAGLQPTRGTPGEESFVLGDIITHINDVRVRNMSELKQALAGAGQKVKLRYYRNGAFYDVEVEVRR